MRSFPLDSILSHWSKLYEGMDASSDEFYDAVMDGLERRRLPETRIRRIEWAEGGVLSPSREYLRIEGSGFRFDLCAAPFGTGYFFSWWLVQKPAERVALHLLLFLVGTILTYRTLANMTLAMFGQSVMFDMAAMIARIVLQNPITISAASILLLLLLVSLLSRGGWKESEDAILTVPVLGWVHEWLFAPVTFYRLDTASMFRATVHQAVLEALDELTTKKGLKALAPEERKPTLDRLG